MYKVLSKIFGILTVLFGFLFLCVKFLNLKASFLRKNKNEKKIIATGANNNFLKSIILKFTKFAAPVYIISKIKTILNDHKKAKRRRKLYSTAAIMLTALGIRKKHKKSKALKV